MNDYFKLGFEKVASGRISKFLAGLHGSTSKKLSATGHAKKSTYVRDVRKVRDNPKFKPGEDSLAKNNSVHKYKRKKKEAKNLKVLRLAASKKKIEQNIAKHKKVQKARGVSKAISVLGV